MWCPGFIALGEGDGWRARERLRDSEEKKASSVSGENLKRQPSPETRGVAAVDVFLSLACTKAKGNRVTYN